MTARVVALYNRKGGTGKTTLTLACAAAAARAGARVRLLDADPAGDAAAVAVNWRLVRAAPWTQGWTAGGEDLVLIDCPPEVAPPALADADLVVVPVLCEPLAVRRLAALLPALDQPYKVVVNGYYQGSSTDNLLSTLTEMLGEDLWLPPIPRRTAFPRSQETKTPVQQFRGRATEVVESVAHLTAKMLTWAPTS